MDTILHLQQNYKRSTLVRYGIAAFAGAAFLRAVYLRVRQSLANKEIAFRKKQLARDVYVLEGDQLVNFPWNASNINEWLYRRVQIQGRPLYYKECMIPNKSVELDGFQQVIPLVTRQTPQKQQGIMLSKGFVPAKFKNPNDRVRIEDVTKQTFNGYVSKLQQLSESGWFDGNATNYRRHDFTHANLLDFAEASGFQNKSQMSVALIERLEPIGPIDERNPQRRAHDCDYAIQYPYAKTYAGALQLRKMPWDYRNESYLWLGVAALGAIKFFI